MSKSARKRLARQTAKAAAAPPVLSPGIKGDFLESVSGKTKSNGESQKANGSGSMTPSISSTERSREASEEIKEVVKENVVAAKDKVEEKATQAKEFVESGIKTAQSNVPTIKSALATASTPATPSPAPSKASKPVEIKSAQPPSSGSSNAKQAQTPPTKSAFSPSLPSSLPAPSAHQLPSNRKRKTPQDFTPTGPGTPTGAPTSPVKNGVTFEDGVAPGQGRDGERTIPKKKKDQNAMERTIWTFIMIFGFIGLLCAGHPYMILLVMLCQTLVYKEVTALFNLRDRE